MFYEVRAGHNITTYLYREAVFASCNKILAICLHSGNAEMFLHNSTIHIAMLMK
jgi:hypothetical protein